MELSELASYANERYRITEEHKWADFPGFSVLCHPQTGKWIALLMRQWDSERGAEIQRCDLKCGSDSLLRFRQAYLSQPIRMRSGKWIGIAFDGRTDREIVFRLFDRAVEQGNPHGFTMVLASQLPSSGAYQDTALPFAGSGYQPPKESLPERLRQIRRLYEYGRESVQSRAKNFYQQAVWMQDYEDDLPWEGEFVRYFPTYHDLTTRQLRGYFTWRARLRRGDIQPIAASAAYIYLYELLNGVGADAPEQILQKLREFEAGYLDAGFGDARMRANLRRWMLEYAVLQGLPQALARQSADPDMIAWDTALAALRAPDAHTDAEVFSALCTLGGKKPESSPVLANDPERGRHLFSQAWRSACADRGQDLFARCFGAPQTRPWYPLSNAVYYDRSGQTDRSYVLDDCRSYRCARGVWQMKAYEKPSFDRARLQGFLHETDARLRRYLKTGRYLRENAADAWAAPYADAVIEAEKQALLEAARPKITIDLSELELIRRNADATRDSLLTGEEPEDAEAAAAPAPEPEQPSLPLDAVQIRILRALLAGRDPAELLRSSRMMPSIAADAINEALLDTFGDTVILCEADRLLLVDDYTEELNQYLGGASHG